MCSRRLSAAAKGIANGMSTVLRWCGGCSGFRGLLAFGIEDDEATRTHARRGSRESGGGKGEVEQTALARGHRIKRVGLASATNLFDRSFGSDAKLLLAKDLKVLGVEGDSLVVLVLEAENLGSDVLYGEEKLAITRGEQGGVRAGELDTYIGGI